MSNHPSAIRPGMTAAIAVLALSSTSALAQVSVDAPAANAGSAPVLVIPPPVSAPTIAATPAPKPAIVPAAPFAITPSEPVEDTTAAAAPVARKKPTASTARIAAPRTTTPTATQAPVAPTRTAEVDKPAAQAAPAVAPASKPALVPVRRTTTTTVTTSDDSDVLPLAGAGLAALLLAGGAFALGRKRREHKAGDEIIAKNDVIPAVIATPAVPTPVAVAQPAMATASPRQETTKTLPAGFDLSRFGPHVQAAYHGPTEENPSFSLRKRLRRARFMDQRERAATDGLAPAPARQAMPANVAGSAQPQRKREPLIAWSNTAPKASFQPAFQS